MRILYDFRAYQVYKQRGIARYIYHMFESAIRQNSGPAYILLYQNDIEPHFSPEVTSKVIFRYQETFERRGYANETYDFFIIGSHFLPSLSAENAITSQYPAAVMAASHKKACILYDFIPLFFHQHIMSRDLEVSFAMQTEALRYLDHIFPISMFTLYSGIRYLNRPATDFTCLYGGADEKKFLTRNSGRPYEKKNRGPHLIYVGGDAPQKNTEGIVRAFCRAYRRDKLPENARLYIVCRASRAFIDTIRWETSHTGCKYGKQVVATNYIPDKKMIELLSTARASIFPSFYEGLGLPILESYAAGTPCWASGVSSTQELVLPECTFDPFDDESMIQAVISIYQSEELCRKSLNFGRELLKWMNWDTGARKLLDACKRLSQEI